MDSTFIQALSQCLQSFCNGHVHYDRDVKIIGHLYVSVDSKDNNYFLNEKLIKSDNKCVNILSDSVAVSSSSFSGGDIVQEPLQGEEGAAVNISKLPFQPKLKAQDINQEILRDTLISQNNSNDSILEEQQCLINSNQELQEVTENTFKTELSPDKEGRPKSKRRRLSSDRVETETAVQPEAGPSGMRSLADDGDHPGWFDPTLQMKVEPDVCSEEEGHGHDGHDGEQRGEEGSVQDSEVDTRHTGKEMQIGTSWNVSEEEHRESQSVHSLSSDSLSARMPHRRANERISLKQSNSQVWNYFETMNNGTAVVCLLCQTPLMYNGSTSIMHNHINHKHSVKTTDVWNHRPNKYYSKPKARHGQSLAWDHFVKSEDGRKASCMHCKQVLSFNDSTSAMLRHIKSKHPEDLKERVKMKEDNSDNVKEEVDLDRRRSYEQSEETADQNRSHEYSKTTIHPKNESYETSKPLARFPKNRSPCWRYFVKTEDGRNVLCLMCNRLFAFAGSSTSNMRKHIRDIHPAAFEVYEKDVNEKPGSSEEAIQDTSHEMDQETLTENVQFKSQLKVKSCVWNFFNKVEEGKFVACLICEQRLTFSSSSSTSGMLRHMKLKHADYLELEEERMQKQQPDLQLEASPEVSEDNFPEISQETLQETSELISQVISQETSQQ